MSRKCRATDSSKRYHEAETNLNIGNTEFVWFWVYFGVVRKLPIHTQK